MLQLLVAFHSSVAAQHSSAGSPVLCSYSGYMFMSGVKLASFLCVKLEKDEGGQPPNAGNATTAVFLKHSRMDFTFSLYSSLMMEQFKMEEGSSMGRLSTWVTVFFLELSTASAFSFRMS